MKRHIPTAAKPNSTKGWLFPGSGTSCALAANTMVSTVVAPAAPGVTVGGLNVAVSPAGSPVSDMLTTLVKEPPNGATLILTLTMPPAATVIGVVGPVIAKAGLITRFTGADVDPADAALPEKTAVITSVPEGRELTVKVATPALFSVAVPSSVAPLRKFTVPKGEPVGAGATVTVSVTACPAVAGLGEVVSVVVVGVPALMVTL